MKITITDAENGFVVAVEDTDDNTYYFVALDVEDVCSIVQNILVEPANVLDMTNIAFEAVPSDR
jgi:predicted metal-binding protein